MSSGNLLNLRSNFRPILSGLLIGTVIRLLAAPFLGHPWDINTWIKVGELSIDYGVNVYEISNPTEFPWGFYTYPPTWLYWSSLVYLISKFLGGVNITVLLLKLPIIFFDILLGLLVYKVVYDSKHDTRRASTAFHLWYLNPVTIFISSVWGMFDSLATYFLLLSAVLVARKDYRGSALTLGIGSAVKIFPALALLVTIPILLFRDGLKPARIMKDYLVFFAVPPLIVSIPFLGKISQYLGSMFFHFQNVGQFTYWALLSTIVNVKQLGYIMFIILIATVAIILYKTKLGRERNSIILYQLHLAVLLAFLATSIKVNVHYITWVLPFLIILHFLGNGTRYLQLTIGLTVASTVFILGTLPFQNFYNLSYLGYVNLSPYLGSGLFGFLVVLGALAGSAYFLSGLATQLGATLLPSKLPSRWAIFGFLIAFAVAFSTFPTPGGVSIPNHPIRVGVIESVDSSFRTQSDYDVGAFLKRYDLTHIVIMTGPDFVNEYNGYQESSPISKYFRYRSSTLSWSQKDLKGLVGTLKENNLDVLLGVYFTVKTLAIHYGAHGFTSEWLLQRHPEVLVEGNLISSDNKLRTDVEFGIAQSERYAEYFTRKLLALSRDFGFNGVYFVTEKNGRAPKELYQGVFPMLDLLEPRLGKGYDVFLQAPNILTSDIDYNPLLEKVDFLVLHTSPWLNSVYNSERESKTLDDYMKYVDAVLSSARPELRKKVLFGIFAMDFAEGWLTPAGILQSEVRSFDREDLSGYVIYHTNNFLPYRLKTKP